jgi:hypothetical protein
MSQMVKSLLATVLAIRGLTLSPRSLFIAAMARGGPSCSPVTGDELQAPRQAAVTDDGTQPGACGGGIAQLAELIHRVLGRVVGIRHIRANPERRWHEAL